MQLVSTVYRAHQLQLKVQLVSTIYGALMSQLQVEVQLIFKKKERLLPLVVTQSATR
jgi:hypothetical protein